MQTVFSAPLSCDHLAARYLGLSSSHFSPGDKFVSTTTPNHATVYAQAFIAPGGERKLLLINRRNRVIAVDLGKNQIASVKKVEVAADAPAPATSRAANVVELGAFAVAVVKLQAEQAEESAR